MNILGNQIKNYEYPESRDSEKPDGNLAAVAAKQQQSNSVRLGELARKLLAVVCKKHRISCWLELNQREIVFSTGNFTFDLIIQLLFPFHHPHTVDSAGKCSVKLKSQETRSVLRG